MHNYYPEVAKYFPPATGFDTPLTVVEASGSEVLCSDGKTYLDFASGVAVLNIGHRPPRVIEAIRKQLDSVLHTGDIFVNEPYVKLAKKLRTVVPVKRAKFFFANSGAEAVEGCMKLARYVTGRQGILCFRGAFHGRTLGALSVTSSSARYRTGYRPLLGSVYRTPYAYCYRCPFGQKPSSCHYECITTIEEMFRSEVEPSQLAAILVEPLQGEGGYIPAPEKFLTALRDFCDQHGILLIVDEVQTGMGRTGTWFASEQYGITPDIMAIGKGIASGLPLSAVCATDSLMNKWRLGAHGSTFGGNPLATASALATIETIEQDALLPQVNRISKKIFSRLNRMKKKYPIIGDVRGRGYFIGVELVTDRKTKEPNPAAREKIQKYCLKKGLVLIYCGPRGNVLRILPPLNTPEKTINTALDILEEAFSRV